MSSTSTNPSNTAPSRPVRVTRGSGTNELSVYTSVGVDADVAMSLYMRSADDTGVSLMFGEERLTLEFADIGSLEQVRDLADEGVRRLRAAHEKNAMP